MIGGVRVKRGLFALMALLMVLSLCACAPKDDAASTDPAAATAPTVIPISDDPLDEADDIGEGEPDDPEAPDDAADNGDAEAGAQGVSSSQYTYTTVENTALGVKYKYPSDWTDASTEKSIIYEESQPSGAGPARMAITRRDAGNIVVTEEVGMMRLTEFKNSLKASCSEGFKWKKGKRFRFSGNVGFCFTYSGTFGEVPTKGYAAIMYHKKKNCFYLFHFNAPTELYASFDNVRKTLLKSIKV